MIATEAGHLVIHVVDDPVDAAAVASLDDAGQAGAPVRIDARSARNCSELEDLIRREVTGLEPAANAQVVVTNLLDVFYDASIPTRQAAQILGRVKSVLESLTGRGVDVDVFCRRRSGDLGTRSYFLASLCAAADRVYFRKST
jgi:hypothetical protein